MLWKPVIAAALFTLTTPAMADEKGDALVKGWFARLPDSRPLTINTTTTYTIGKRTAVYKNKATHTENFHSGAGGTYQCDDEYPIALYNNPLSENFNPLPDAGTMDRLGIAPSEKTSYTKYLGKETVSGIEYDVVEVRENLNVHSASIGPMLSSLRRNQNDRISVKWYLDAEGILRRMSFTAEIPIPDTYLSLSSAFALPSQKAPGTLLKTAASSRPNGTETFTATMVVDSLRKTRSPLVRTRLSTPLYIVPESSESLCVFSPDSKLLAIRGKDKLQVISAATGQEKYPLDKYGNVGWPIFSLDGNSLAFSDSTGIKVISVANGNLIRALPTAKKSVGPLCLSPDGKRVAVIGASSDVEIWNVETGLLERALKANRYNTTAMFSADGKRLVCVEYGCGILVWDTSAWKIIQRLPLRNFRNDPIALSRDGKYIAAIDRNNDVLLWDGSAPTPVKKLTGAVGYMSSLTFSSDGKTLYSGDSDELSDMPTLAPGYESWDLDTGKLTANCSPWRGNSFLLGRSVVSPDGKLAAFSGSPNASGSIAVYALQAGE